MDSQSELYMGAENFLVEFWCQQQPHHEPLLTPVADPHPEINISTPIALD